jgi:hypothetical protein
MKTCLMDFGRMDCNAASPNEQCSPVVKCILNGQQNHMFFLEIVLKEIEENFIVPSIMIGLLLISRLCQILTENKSKIE